MTVKRIVANIATSDMAAARSFYGDLLGLDMVMDQGWIITLAADGMSPPQISFASEGGAGTQLPDLSLEVDNIDEVHQKLSGAGYLIEYGPIDEPWGVRRFFVRDPFGKLLNILAHSAA